MWHLHRMQSPLGQHWFRNLTGALARYLDLLKFLLELFVFIGLVLYDQGDHCPRPLQACSRLLVGRLLNVLTIHLRGKRGEGRGERKEGEREGGGKEGKEEEGEKEKGEGEGEGEGGGRGRKGEWRENGRGKGEEKGEGKERRQKGVQFYCQKGKYLVSISYIVSDTFL